MTLRRHSAPITVATGNHRGVNITGAAAIDAPAWMDYGLCAQTDPEMFFPEKGGSTREAKRICSTCPVRVDCLEYALEHQERFGIWGGKSERERRPLSPKRLPAPRLNVVRRPGIGRGGSAAALREELIAHGLTSIEVKEWALSQRLITVLPGGPLAQDLLDAYLAAHPKEMTA